MLERTVSLFRHLVGSPAEDLAVEDDRRVWVRHPADLNTTYKLADSVTDERLSARVGNVSQGGIRLLVSRRFQPGEMLSIELPTQADGSTCTVLACIVHAKPEEDGQWALGCTFSRELSDQDLEAFGALRVKHSASDQRTWMRFTTSVKASYRIITDPEPRQVPTQVLNISATGIGLLVSEPVTVGSLLNLELHGASGLAERTMLACVVHVTGRTEGEWALGCNFIRSLSEEDLQALI